MAEALENNPNRIQIDNNRLKKTQSRFILFGLMIVPFLPLLYLQGKLVRLKVGRLPDAQGDTKGRISAGSEKIELLAIGESTVAGVGVKTHEEALTGQFSKHLSEKTEKSIHWEALGVSGITVRRTINELVSKIPERKIDLVLIGLGANDVFSLSSPNKFRKDMREFLEILRGKFPDAKIFLANVPMVRDFIALPNPLRFLLSRLAKFHHFNTIDLVNEFSNVFYFEDVSRVDDDFFSDGIHPSAKGYDLWSEAMVESYLRQIE